MNNFKGNHSPFEAFGGNNGVYDYEKILLRSKNLSRHKQMVILSKCHGKFNDQNSLEFIEKFSTNINEVQGTYNSHDMIEKR